MRVMRLMVLMTALVLGSAVAWGQPKKDLIGSFRDWDAFTLVQGGEKMCYMISIPKDWKASRSGVNRGDIYVTITHRPKAKVRNEVNVIVGYPFKSSSEATAIIDGGRRFKMFTQGDSAWNYRPDDDSDMVNAMRAGATLIVQGTSSRGTSTTDRYSLSGFTAAHNAISQACS